MGGIKKSRCKQCEACLSPNCGVCTYCMDKPIFGGKNSKKQCCVQKRCLNPIHSEANHPPSSMRKPSIDNGASVRKSYVFIRNICEEKVLSKFRVKKQDDETDKEPIENDSSEQKLGRSHRKRKVNLNYINPAEYVPNLKAAKKETAVNKNPLKDINIDKMIEYLDRHSQKDRLFVRTKNEEKSGLEAAPKYTRPQTAKTKKKKLRPYEYLKFLPTQSAAGSKDAFPSPPRLTPHSSENTEGDDDENKYGGPPVLEPCKTEKEPGKLSFSGRYCKPNNAYYQEFYTDLKRIPNICSKPKPRKKSIPKGEADSKFETNEEKRWSSMDAVKKEPEMKGHVEFSGSSTIKREPEVTTKVKFNPFAVTSCSGKKQPSKDLESSLDTMMKKAEKDKHISQLQNRIPVCQDKIMKTVKELAKEKKFVKFFQLNVGNKLIFIPTDGRSVIPKAYVMDKTSDTTKASTIPESTSVIPEPMEDIDNGDLPKITSVFSLSSDGDGGSAESIATTKGQGTTHSNMAAASLSGNEGTHPLRNSENKSVQKLKSLLNPDVLKKQTASKDLQNLQSLVNATVSKIFTHGQQKTAANLNDGSGHIGNPSAPSIDAMRDREKYAAGICDVSLEVSSPQSPPIKDAVDLQTLVYTDGNVPDFGRLKPLETVTHKTQCPSRVQTISNFSNPNYLFRMDPSTKQRYLILPKSNVNNGQVIVSSAASSGKLQSLLPNSKLQLIVNKETLGPGSQKSTVSSNTSQTLSVSGSPATPVFLFPNVSNKSVPYVPQSTASQIINFEAPVASSAVTASKVITPFSGSSEKTIQATTSNKTLLVTSRSMVNTTKTEPLDKNDPKGQENDSDKVRAKSDKLSSSGTFGHEWVTVKSEPGDEHEFEASILTTIKKEENSDTESETETKEGETDGKDSSWRMPQFPDHQITSVRAGETDTKERIRQLREKLRVQQEECENLKKTLLSENDG